MKIIKLILAIATLPFLLVFGIASLFVGSAIIITDMILEYKKGK